MYYLKKIKIIIRSIIQQKFTYEKKLIKEAIYKEF